MERIDMRNYRTQRSAMRGIMQPGHIYNRKHTSLQHQGSQSNQLGLNVRLLSYRRR